MAIVEIFGTKAQQAQLSAIANGLSETVEGWESNGANPSWINSNSDTQTTRSRLEEAGATVGYEGDALTAKM
jgi:hypothetical protein